MPLFAQVLPACSWPLEITGTGLTNVAYPDTNATYWTMPIDSTRWQSIVIKGAYPQSRFFSFVPYVAQGAVANNAALNDVDINPDPGSTNPFRQAAQNGTADYYTVTASRYPPTGNETNFLPLGATRLAWIIYRVYVPDKGLSNNAGVPLPSITVVGRDGRSRELPPCHANNATEASPEPSGTPFSQGLVTDAAAAQLPNGFEALKSSAASCQPTPLISWIPANTGGYFPNPANKYIAVPGLCFQPDRVVVVRGKGAVFPDTFNGHPIWEPPGVNMRYWSLCNNNQKAPYPVVDCVADYKTSLDAQGYYTYVLSEPDSRNADTPPSWIPAGASWISWGSKIAPNILLMRNMLPDPAFPHSVQDAIQQGCAVDNESGSSPSRESIVAGGDCAKQVMGDYYPTAVYCPKQVLINEGWQGCFAAAGLAGH